MREWNSLASISPCDGASRFAVENLGFQPDPMQAANFQQLTTVELRLRDVARVPLDTPYTEVARKVAEAIARPPFNGNSTLAIDATGVGRPVVDHLRMMRPPCRMVPVVITGRAGRTNPTARSTLPGRT